MKDFVKYLVSHNYDQQIEIPENVINYAFEQTLADVQFHYSKHSPEHIRQSVVHMHAELSIFLFRLGQQFYSSGDKNRVSYLHGLMRRYCACEFYFSNEIGEGFFPVHGVGTVIGSRCKIGRGFMIYHNCTVGHIADNELGCSIGDFVTVYPGSMILGDITIGNEVVIGANSVVFSDIKDKSVCAGNPAKVVNHDSYGELKKHRLNYI